MSKFLANLKSYVHSLSTSDHYAAYDPNRTSSQQDAKVPLAYPSSSSAARMSSSSIPSSRPSSSAGAPVGSRSAQLNSTSRGSADNNGAEIALDDMSPIPSPQLSWERIETFLEKNYPELGDQILSGATEADVNELEHDIDASLPADVRESMMVHDGQERGGRPTGLFFGITILDLESVSEEWAVWRNTAVRLNELRRRNQASKPAPKGPSSSSAPASPVQPRRSVPNWVEHQRSFPREHIQPVYCHPGWIPLAKDFEGNNIAVDTAPGPRGRYGQVILFGRDFDTKFVVSPSWGDFLAQFAADIESGNWFIDDDFENAVFAYKQPYGRLVSYFELLRRRATSNAQNNNSASTHTAAESASSTTAETSGDTRADTPLANGDEPQEETIITLTPANGDKDASKEDAATADKENQEAADTEDGKSGENVLKDIDLQK